MQVKNNWKPKVYTLCTSARSKMKASVYSPEEQHWAGSVSLSPLVLRTASDKSYEVNKHMIPALPPSRGYTRLKHTHEDKKMMKNRISLIHKKHIQRLMIFMCIFLLFNNVYLLLALIALWLVQVCSCWPEFDSCLKVLCWSHASCQLPNILF